MTTYQITEERAKELRTLLETLFSGKSKEYIAKKIAEESQEVKALESSSSEVYEASLKTVTSAIQEYWVSKVKISEPITFPISEKQYLRVKSGLYNYCLTIKAIISEKDFDLILDMGIKNEPKRTIIPTYTPTTWFNEKTFPNELQGSKYYFFERYGEDSKLSDEWGITVGTITFEHNPKPKTGFLPVVLRAIDKDGCSISLSGIASISENKAYLYIDLINKDKMRCTITIKYSVEDDRQIMIGQDSYNKNKTLQTKSIILIKDKYLKPNEVVFGMINHKDVRYKSIPQVIRHFMYERSLNRISTPKQVHNLNILSDFIRGTDLYKYSQVIKDNFCGEYSIYFKEENTDGSNIKIDNFKIYYDEDANRIFAEYSHRMVESGLIINYIGDVFFSIAKRQIIFELNNSKKTSEKIKKHKHRESEDPLLLSMLTPDLKVPFSKTECFCCVVSGLADTDLTGVAYVGLVIRKSFIKNKDCIEFKHDENIINTAVENFFKSQAYGTMLQPTTNNYFMLKDYLK